MSSVTGLLAHIFVILVGLSTLSLNQIAECVTQAEALSDEIASICKDLAETGALRAGLNAPSSKSLSVKESPIKTRLWYPYLYLNYPSTYSMRSARWLSGPKPDNCLRRSRTVYMGLRLKREGESFES
jgi:hypothetical protein